jgi:hypothetical protein
MGKCDRGSLWKFSSGNFASLLRKADTSAVESED